LSYVHVQSFPSKPHHQLLNGSAFVLYNATLGRLHTAVYIPFLLDGEIDPEFVADYYNELNKLWIIFNNDGTFNNTVTFNQSFENPQLAYLWRWFSESLNLPANVEIQFAYYGNDYFQVQSFKQLRQPHQIPGFHSRSTCPTNTIIFEVKLTSETMAKDHLVTISNT
jgi:hypothetical protein